MLTLCSEYSMQSAELARAIEERGRDGFHITEHTHIQVATLDRLSGGRTVVVAGAG